MKHHPEQLEDEIYMGNSTIEGILKSSWRTIRRGTVALRSDGNPVNDHNEDFKPWFIKVSEVEATIESERLADRPWSAERIRTLQPMIDERTVSLGGGGAEPVRESVDSEPPKENAGDELLRERE